VLLARTTREVWGEQLKRYIVFGQVGRETSKTFYPWTEFVETSDGDYAALIPDPARPRSPLSDGNATPGRFRLARVERTDRLYRGVKKGPTLRLVVPEEDPEAMIRHGYWVAQIRGRLRP
jgi:hypothetical protein